MEVQVSWVLHKWIKLRCQFCILLANLVKTENTLETLWYYKMNLSDALNVFPYWVKWKDDKNWETWMIN